MNLFFSMLSYVMVVICVLINVAFVTLLERKVLGLSQLRLGPNKNGFMGIMQPFSDAIKLFSKQNSFPFSSNMFFFLLSPCVALMITLFLWSLIPLKYNYMHFTLSILLFMMILSMGVYPLLLAGWSSSSKYALLGAVRGVAQTISYEISLALILISIMLIPKSLNFLTLMTMETYMKIYLASPFLLFMWMISMLAESNRTPFDFAEGESELVSGFNIEYAAVGFALLFMAEYGSILFLSTTFIFLFLGMNMFYIYGSLMSIFLSFFWIWARATYPRYRYDLLMEIAWKSLLPQILGLSTMFCSVILIV